MSTLTGICQEFARGAAPPTFRGAGESPHLGPPKFGLELGESSDP